MTTTTSPTRTTALLVLDPYNDFMSERGKFWPLTHPTVEGVQLRTHLGQLLAAWRRADMPVVYVPHVRFLDGQHRGWLHLNPMQRQAEEARSFEVGTWGGEFRADLAPENNDIVVGEHWSQNGFVGTDLHVQLSGRGVTHVVVTGMIANTCVDATARHAGELGYHVTLVQDAIAAWDWKGMQATFEVNAPAYAHAIVQTAELLDAVAIASSPTRNS